MSRFITPAREYFIDFFSWGGVGIPEVPPAPPWAEWHGPAPRLATADGSTSFARHNEYESPYNAPMAVIELPPGDYTNATVHMQIRTTTEFWPRPFIAGPGAHAYGSNWELDQGATAYPPGEWVTLTAVMDTWTAPLDPSQPAIAGPGYVSDGVNDWDLSWLAVSVPGGPVDGILAIDTHDHPFHVVGTRDPAMPYELVIDTGTERVVEIVAGEEHLATHELVVDETGRPGTPWSHAGLFRPI